jgi:adenylate kinase
MKRPDRLVITGNPGVGKHTCARLVAKELKGFKIIDINKTAIVNDAILKVDEKYGIDINIRKVRNLLEDAIESNNEGLIFVGHLAPYVLDPVNISKAIVLRRSPYELVSVFQKRHYTIEKTKENIASEILGVSFYDSLMSFGKNKIVEVDVTGETPSKTADRIIALLRNRSIRHPGIVDWISLVYANGDLQRFLEY